MLVRLNISIVIVHLIALLTYTGLHSQSSTDQSLRRRYSPWLLDDAPGVKLAAASDLKLLNAAPPPELVPRIVHYTWYSWHRNTFRFHHLISLLSALKFLRPVKIMFWCGREPEGPWWRVARQRAPQLQVMVRASPTQIFGRPVRVPEHQSDVVRLEAILKYGGIYLDLDVIVLRPFDALMYHDVSMGYQLDGHGLCNGVIVAKPNAKFLQLWYQEYAYFLDRSWDYHSVKLPGLLARRWPHLLHVERTTFHRPNFNERNWIYKTGQLYNWRSHKNYALHLWYRFYGRDHTPQDIRTLNSTLGAIFRLIWYNSDRLLPPSSENRAAIGQSNSY